VTELAAGRTRIPLQKDITQNTLFTQASQCYLGRHDNEVANSKCTLPHEWQLAICTCGSLMYRWVGSNSRRPSEFEVVNQRTSWKRK
jgi:hypothetical protein